LLEGLGARVSTASASASALELIRTSKPDVLVSDIGLPGEDGYAFIGRVRALSPELGGMIPAIALTAYTSMADRNRAIAAGFQAHLSKPLEAPELSAIVARLAGRRADCTE
jgi:CheY-like chemotaxis protein